MDSFRRMNADVFCVQETKMAKGQAEIDLAGYEEYWNSAVKKGYSGTAVFTRIRPLNVSCGLGMAEHDQEGRVITVEFDRHYLVNVYTPNAQRALARLDYRMRWEDDFRAYLLSLSRHKPVIACGDMNVAHEEIDIKNPKSNRRNAGFTDEERAKMTALLQAGFIDTFRRLNPDQADAYTWWSYMNHARERNVGWRIDYFVISEELAGSFKDAVIYADIYGSDHCPVGLEVDSR
jgi:exodeoxyribonuclease-3